MRTLKPRIVFLSLLLSACNGMKPATFDRNQESSGTPMDGRPTAVSTGWQHTGAKLTPSNDVSIFNDGVTVDQLDINGGIIINASNVTIRRSFIHSTSSYFPIRILSGTNIVIEDVEIDGKGFAAKGILIDDGSVTIRRLNLHDSAVGIHITGNGPTVIESSFIHSPRRSAGIVHADGLEIEKAANLTIQGNNLSYVSGGTSAAMIDNYSGAVANVLLTGNWLAGGDYSLFLDGSLSGKTIDNVSVRNNHWSRGSAASGPFAARGMLSNVCWDGNEFDDNNLVLNYSGPGQVACP